MKRNTFIYTCCVVVGAMLASCSSDDEPLAYGEFPLHIASATVSETGSRVAESADGTSSHWTDGDQIAVRIGDDGKTGFYTLNADGSVKTADTPVYWQSKAPQTVTAWYPATDGAIDLSDQTEGLKYVLKATAEDMTFSDAVNLDFKHQLAKIRVKLSGDKATDVTAVAVKGLTSFSTEQGKVGTATNEGYIKMMKATYTDGDYYEANLTPQTINAADFVQISIDNKTFICEMDCDVTTIETGNAYTFTVTVISEDKPYADTETHTVTSFEEGQISDTPDIIDAAISDDGYLKVVGPINQSDLEAIIEKCKDKITVLDLSEAYGTDLKIPDEAFSGNTNLTSISFPQGLVSIGESAFCECKTLSGALVIPEGITEVGEKAFGGCINITSIKLPSTMTTLKDGTFYGCYGLTEIDIPANITTIEGHRYAYGQRYQGAFGDCNNVKTLTLHSGLTRIGDHAFADCASLEEVSIPESVTSIGIYAFYRCSGLTKVELPKNLDDIDGYAFSECVGLKEPLYNERAFVYYHSDSNVSYSIPNGIEKICGGAFYKCTGLQSIKIPTSITFIGNGAFAYCTGLTSVNVPANVTTIDYGAFRECSNLTTASLPQEMPSLEYTFANCTKLQTVEFLSVVAYLSERLTTLYYTFSGCTSLTSITIPESVTSIDYYTFSGCSSLTSLTIPDAVTTIGRNTFAGCSGLTSIVLSAGLTSIGYDAFDGCTGLTTLTCKATTPPTCEDDVFNDISSDCVLKVPQNSMSLYRETSPWSHFSYFNVEAIEE